MAFVTKFSKFIHIICHHFKHVSRFSEFRNTLAGSVARTAKTDRPIILTQNGRVSFRRGMGKTFKACSRSSA